MDGSSTRETTVQNEVPYSVPEPARTLDISWLASGKNTTRSTRRLTQLFKLCNNVFCEPTEWFIRVLVYSLAPWVADTTILYYCKVLKTCYHYLMIIHNHKSTIITRWLYFIIFDSLCFTHSQCWPCKYKELTNVFYNLCHSVTSLYNWKHMSLSGKSVTHHLWLSEQKST